MAESRPDLLQGTLDLLVLKTLALGPLHGYGIAQRLKQVSRNALRVPMGSIYPALYRLEAAGAVASTWETTDTGREARFYRLTPAGQERLAAEAENWRRLAAAVGLVLAAT
jgi:PadR family transcriptional regulator